MIVDGTERPILDIQIQLKDSDIYCEEDLEFEWECIDYQPDLMLIQLVYDNPSCISAGSNEGDILLMTFYG